MTREEAIKILEYPVKKWSMEWDEREDGLSYYEALGMAISALRQQETVTKCNDLFDDGGGEILNDETVTDRCQMTNAQKIRSMSDEEIADWVSVNGAIKTPCDIICGGDCKAIATIEKSSIERCKEIVMKWLKQPAEEEKK